MPRLGLGLGLFRQLRDFIMGIRSDVGDQYSSHIYDAGDYTGRVLFRTVPNIPPGPGFPSNTVGWIGANIQNNANPIDPDIPAFGIAGETSYYNPTAGQTQTEFHLNVMYKGLTKRPLSIWQKLSETPSERVSNFTLRGSVTVADDNDSPYVRFSSTSRRLTLYTGVHLGTTTDAPVPIRGIELTSGKELGAYAGARVPLRGAEIVGGFTLRLSAYTVGGLPSPSDANQIALVTDDVGGLARTIVISDGTNWRRSYDGAVASDT